jgi:hypothetical protein
VSDPELPEEERIRALMRRSDGPVLIRPLRAPAAARRSSVGALAAIALVAMVVVASAVAGLALNARRQEVAASPSPTPSASSAAIQPSPSVADLAPDARRMLLVNLGGHGIGIRTEAATAPYFRGTSRTRHAISPNGKLAYWKTGEDDALPHELHVYDTTTRTDRTILTLTEERGGAGGFLVWSTDGTGIAVGTSDPGSVFEGRLSPGRPRVATWSLLDLASGARRKIATISDAWIVPVSWDRSTDVATATEYGRDGPSTSTRLFYVFDQSRAAGKATQLLLPAAIDPWTVHADSGARSAVGLEPYGSGPFTGRNIWTWPLRDPTAAVPRKIPGRLVFQADFRPGTTDVYALTGSMGGIATPPPERPVIQDLGPLASSASVRDVYRTPGGGYFFFRSDGTAIIVGMVDLNDRRGAVVDPATGASTVLALEDDVLASIGPPPAQALASPAPSPIASGSPFPTQPPPGFATPEEAADAVRRALEGPDYQLLPRLVRPAGWYAQWFEQGKTDPMALAEAVGWLTAHSGTKRTVDARPVFPTNAQHPLGESYVTSHWLDFGGWPEQRADIMLGRDGGRWYWTSVLLYRPPPVSPGPDLFSGYATLQAVGETTLTVRFRAVGSRCCSDPTWNGKTVTLRRDRTTWMRAGGVAVATFAETGATTGTDVWVQFAPSTLAPDGTYRLSDFAKMFP